jgi:hypothetical protein
MERYGISYKDAAHRLYMTETAKLTADDRSKKAFATLKERTQGSLSKLQNKLKEINTSTGPEADAEEEGDHMPEAEGQ